MAAESKNSSHARRNRCSDIHPAHRRARTNIHNALNSGGFWSFERQLSPGSVGLHILDNPAWHALSTRQANFAEGDDHAKRFPVEITRIAATADQSPASYDSLAKLLRPNEEVGLLSGAPESLPANLTLSRTAQSHQMVWTGKQTLPQAQGVETLTSGDADEMLALAELTQPGPFGRRTGELGLYLGIRDSGKLVAMAGERLQPPEYTEISAVCTHPAHRGHGYASTLVSSLVNRIFERGETPFLHVRAVNTSAIRVYERLGFETRCIFDISVVRRT